MNEKSITLILLYNNNNSKYSPIHNDYNIITYTIIIIIKLTLRPLSVFFKILPISNTGISAANILATVGTVRFLYPKLAPFSDTEYYF